MSVAFDAGSIESSITLQDAMSPGVAKIDSNVQHLDKSMDAMGKTGKEAFEKVEKASEKTEKTTDKGKKSVEGLADSISRGLGGIAAQNLTHLGESLASAVKDFQKFGEEGGGALSEVGGEANSISDAIKGKLAPSIKEFLKTNPQIAEFATSLGMVSSQGIELVGTVEQITTAFAGMEAAALPLAALAITATLIYMKWDQVKNAFEPLSTSVNELEKTFERFSDTIKHLVDPGSPLDNLFKTVDGLFQKFKELVGIKGELDWLAMGIKVAFAPVAMTFIEIAGLATNIVDGVAGGLKLVKALSGGSVEEIKSTWKEFKEQQKKDLEETAANFNKYWENIGKNPASKPKLGKIAAPEPGKGGGEEAQARELKFFDIKDFLPRTFGQDLQKAFQEQIQSQDWKSMGIEIARDMDGDGAAKAYVAAYDAELSKHPLGKDGQDTEEAKQKATHAGQEAAQAYTEAFTQIIQSQGKALLSQVVSSYEGMLEQNLKALQQKIAKQNWGIDVFTQAWQKAKQKEIADFTDAEDQKIAIATRAANARMALIDDEYAAKKRALDAEYKLQQSAYRKDFDSKLQLLHKESRVKEEDQLATTTMNEGFRRFEKSKEAQHQQALADLAAEGNSKKTTEKAQSDAQIAQMEQDKNDKIAELQKKKEEEDKVLRKGSAFIKWQSDSAALEASKRIQTAQVMASAAMGIGQAWSGALSSPASILTFGAAGITLASMLTALIGGMAARSVGLIRSQQVMPPAELFAASGNPYAPSGKNIMVGEQGPELIRLGQTSQIVSNKQLQGTGGMTIQKGAIVIYVQGNLDKDAVEPLSQSLGRRFASWRGR